MTIFRALLAVGTVCLLAGAHPKTPKTVEDMGPDTIDVSAYPDDMQKIYKEIFLRYFGFSGTTARVINSPLIEMDEWVEEQERRNHPSLFSDPQVAQVTRDGWKQRVKDWYMTPPCCGACPILRKEEAIDLRRFLVYDSLERKTGPNADAWIAHRKDLLKRFADLKRSPPP